MYHQDHLVHNSVTAQAGVQSSVEDTGVCIQYADTLRTVASAPLVPAKHNVAEAFHGLRSTYRPRHGWVEDAVRDMTVKER